jgi:XLF N-terminal domain
MLFALPLSNDDRCRLFCAAKFSGTGYHIVLADLMSVWTSVATAAQVEESKRTFNPALSTSASALLQMLQAYFRQHNNSEMSKATASREKRKKKRQRAKAGFV